MVYLVLPGNFGYCHESVIGNSFKGSLKVSFSFLLGEYCWSFFLIALFIALILRSDTDCFEFTVSITRKAKC